MGDICGEGDDDEYELYVCPHEEFLQHGIIMSIGVVSVNTKGEVYDKIANLTTDFMYLKADACVVQAVPMDQYEILDGDDIHRQITLLIQEKYIQHDALGAATQMDVTALVH